MELISSAIASPNIAFVKYWGKRDDKLKLSTNDSLSMTLDDSALASKTTVLISDKLARDIFVINGKKVEDDKISEFLSLIRERLEGKGVRQIRSKMLIISANNFPTGAGIASSASGFCALACAICSAFGINDKKEWSVCARLGSGSASRSVYGGFVRWQSGSRADGEDSYAVQVAPKSHWGDMVDIILITNAKEKKVSSKMGMESTARTSELYSCRLKHVGERLERAQSALMNKEFPELMECIMRDSNSMHSTMLDSWPPVIYLNDISKEIIESIHALNESGVIAGYTFDAGPNAHIITTRVFEKAVLAHLKSVKGIKSRIVSGVGDGARVLPPDKKLANATLKALKMKL